MNKEQGEESWVEKDKPEYDRNELGRNLAELVDLHGGDYSESLKVDAEGRVMHRSRNRDDASALLPTFLETKNRRDPSIEDVYQALKDIGEVMPGYEISINEDRTAGIFEYRIKRMTSVG